MASKGANVIKFCVVALHLKNLQVFFMADVSELRMELIFPRSTLARLTPSGLAGALAEVGVPVVEVAAAEALFFEAFVGVVGTIAACIAGSLSCLVSPGVDVE